MDAGRVLAAAGTAVLAVACLPALLLARFLVRQAFRAVYLTNFTPLRDVPTLPLSSWRDLLLGHPFWGTASYVRRIDSVTVADSLNALRERLGPIFVLRNFLCTPTLQIADVDALRHVCFAGAARYPKTRPARRAMGMLLGAEGIIFAEGAKHMRIKRIVAPALHFEAVGIFGAALLEEARALADAFVTAATDRPRDPLPLKRAVGAATFSAIIRAFVGKARVAPARLQALEDAYLACIEEMTVQLPGDILRMSVLDFVPAAWISSSRRKKLFIRAEVAELLEDAMRRSAAPDAPAAPETPAAQDDPAILLALMAKAAKDAARLSTSEMTDTMMSFLSAGQATSALSCAWTLYRLALHPEHLARLQAEIDASCWTAHAGDAADVDATVKQLDALPFLAMCVKEGLRLHPPAAYSIRISGERDTLCGHTIPPGTMVNIPILALHVSPRHWGVQPHDFNPAHFTPEAERGRDPLAWCPFLAGSRGCLGRPFAMLEIKAFVAETVRRCDVFVEPGAPQPKMYGGLSGYPPGLRLFGRPRTLGRPRTHI